MRLPAIAIAPEEAAVLRAMLLFDRSFLDRSESVNFQKTRRLSHPGRSWIARRSVCSFFILSSS
jgi:hypothetical protein